MNKSPSYRQQRQHITRERILEAAIELARAEGWSTVTMRKVADRVGYTHAALYAYFDSKEGLLLALLQEGTQLLRAKLEAAKAAAQTPEAALRTGAAAYWDFACQYPEHYQIMHGLGGVAFNTPDALAQGQYIGEVVGSVVTALLVKHGKDLYKVDQKVELLWSTIHGIVTLTMTGRFAQQQATELIEQGVRDACLAWGIQEQFQGE